MYHLLLPAEGVITASEFLANEVVKARIIGALRITPTCLHVLTILNELLIDLASIPIIII
jgi:hypothetical protein